MKSHYVICVDIVGMFILLTDFFFIKGIIAPFTFTVIELVRINVVVFSNVVNYLPPDIKTIEREFLGGLIDLILGTTNQRGIQISNRYVLYGFVLFCM